MIEVDCVSMLSRPSSKANDLIIDQHKLRYREVIAKEKWGNVYVVGDMEFDQYDNIATEYLIAKNSRNEAVGVSRLYPTTLPYMLMESFKYLSGTPFPSSPEIMEASRLVLDRSKLSKEERKPVIDKLILAYMERGLQRKISGYIGFMLPKIWESTFLRVGWDVMWLGDEKILQDTGDVIRAGFMAVNEEMQAKIRDKIQISEPVLRNHSIATVSNDKIFMTKGMVEKQALERKVA